MPDGAKVALPPDEKTSSQRELRCLCSPTNTIATMPATKLFVGNLPETIRQKDLQSEFEKFGKVVECDIIRDYAFVHFEKSEEARAAVKDLNNKEIKGTKIRVEMSKSNVRQKAGMADSNSCFRCGDAGHWSRDCHKNDDVAVAERLAGRREREAARQARSRSPVRERDPYHDYYDAYYRDRYAAYYSSRYSAYDYPPRRSYYPPPHPRDYDDDPYSRPPPEYYSASTRAPVALPPPLPPRRDSYYDDPYAYRSQPRVTEPERSAPPAVGNPSPY